MYFVYSAEKPVGGLCRGAAVGVRRVSVGAALAKATYGAFDGLVELLRDKGRLS